MPLPGRVVPPFFLSPLPASRFDYVGQKRKNAKTQKCKFAKLQNIIYNTQTISRIGFVCLCKNLHFFAKRLKIGRFEGRFHRLNL